MLCHNNKTVFTTVIFEEVLIKFTVTLGPTYKSSGQELLLQASTVHVIGTTSHIHISNLNAWALLQAHPRSSVASRYHVYVNCTKKIKSRER